MRVPKHRTGNKGGEIGLRWWEPGVIRGRSSRTRRREADAVGAIRACPLQRDVCGVQQGELGRERWEKEAAGEWLDDQGRRCVPRSCINSSSKFLVFAFICRWIILSSHPPCLPCALRFGVYCTRLFARGAKQSPAQPKAARFCNLYELCPSLSLLFSLSAALSLSLSLTLSLSHTHTFSLSFFVFLFRSHSLSISLLLNLSLTPPLSHALLISSCSLLFQCLSPSLNLLSP